MNIEDMLTKAILRKSETMFLNHYEHCDILWSDEWASTCNDRCPKCNKEVEPYASEDITDN